MSRRVQYIKQNLHLSDAELCRDLGISEEYLDAIRHHNGIEKKNWKWSKQEDEYLKAKYGQVPYQEVYQFFKSEFGRTIESVRKRAHKLNLT